MNKIKFIDGSALPSREDDIKAAWTCNESQDRTWRINYYNCWHCKQCDRELERICAICGNSDNDNGMSGCPGGFWCNPGSGGPYQVCFNGCEDIGGWEEFSNT